MRKAIGTLILRYFTDGADDSDVKCSLFSEQLLWVSSSCQNKTEVYSRNLDCSTKLYDNTNSVPSLGFIREMVFLWDKYQL